jgi:antitoxin CptB
MLSAEVLREAEQRRLAWRCRRGMLELDIVLQRFVKENFNALSLQEVEVFDGLLDLPDNAFWALIEAGGDQNNPLISNVITKLKPSSKYVLKDF